MQRLFWHSSPSSQHSPNPESWPELARGSPGWSPAPLPWSSREGLCQDHPSCGRSEGPGSAGRFLGWVLSLQSRALGAGTALARLGPGFVVGAVATAGLAADPKNSSKTATAVQKVADGLERGMLERGVAPRSGPAAERPRFQLRAQRGRARRHPRDSAGTGDPAGLRGQKQKGLCDTGQQREIIWGRETGDLGLLLEWTGGGEKGGERRVPFLAMKVLGECVEGKKEGASLGWQPGSARSAPGMDASKLRACQAAVPASRPGPNHTRLLYFSRIRNHDFIMKY